MNADTQPESQETAEGRVEPERVCPQWLDRLGTVTIWVASCATGLALVGGTCRPTMGATRSAKLEWRRRRGLVRHAVATHDGAATRCQQATTHE